MYSDGGSTCLGPGDRKREDWDGAEAKAAAADARVGPALEADNDMGQWLVAKVCPEYIQYCEHGLASGSVK